MASSDNALSQGQEAPQFSAIDLSGTPVSSDDFTGQLSALLFITPNCPACAESLENDIEYLKHKAEGNLIVICKSGREDCTQIAETFELDVPVVADEDKSISRLFAISSVPMVVIINTDNRIQSYGRPERAKPEELMAGVSKTVVPEAGRDDYR